MARLPAIVAAVLLGVGFAVAGAAQVPGSDEPDLNDLALGWTRGDWRAPLVCTIDGVARRGLRRVLVAPGPRHARPATHRIQFFDLEIPAGTSCTDETGRPQPNVLGVLYFTLEGGQRRDTARHDFSALLRREGGVGFRVRRGRLRLGEGEARREVDFAGGSARFEQVQRGSDAWRRLATFGDQRRLGLALEAPDGSRLELDLVLVRPR